MTLVLCSTRRNKGFGDVVQLAEAAGWDPAEVRAAAAACAPSKVQTDDPKVIQAFQVLFDRTFKLIYTRDRKGQRVPKRLVVESVKRVINMKIWEEYTLRREMALYEDGRGCFRVRGHPLYEGGRARVLRSVLYRGDQSVLPTSVGAVRAPLTAGWVASEATDAARDSS